MRYTVLSHGQEIGETDLGFHRCFERFRSGWFHPNSAGEKLMPVIDAVWPAIFAHMHQDIRDTPGRSIIHPQFPGSRALAEAAEALAGAESLGLQLLRDDGTVVPTMSVGLRGCPHLPELEDIEVADWTPDDESDEADLFESLDEFAAPGKLDGPESRWRSDGWKPEESSIHSDQTPSSADDNSEDAALERYQIHVLLDEVDVIQ